MPSLGKSKGKTVVVAEHCLRCLADLTDRLLAMRDGRIVEELDAAEAYDRDPCHMNM